MQNGSKDDVQVLIAGSGPTGLVLAFWLARVGIKIRLIDKATEAGTTSRAMAVHARTLEFYRQLGIAEPVIAAGLQVGGVNLWGRGVKAARLPIRNIGEGLSCFPFVLDFPQDLHEKLLIDQLKSLGIELERGVELVRFEQHSDGVRSILRSQSGSEEPCTSVYLAGCDGAHSIVREVLGTGFKGGTYEGFFYVADVEASGPSIDDEIHVDLDDGEFVGIFPYKEAGRVRLIGTVHPATEDGNREIRFDDVRGRAIEHMRLTIGKVNWFSTYRVHHRVAEHFRQGRAFLLGDAAHVHSPVGGQGMNTGIGDAVNLAWKLAAVLKGQAQANLLDSYEVERIAFARRLVDTTDRIFTLITKQSDLANHVRLELVPRVLPWLTRFSFARRYLFRTVSQIGIQYRPSPLSEGVAGGVHGGDRLPWNPLDSGEDNFVPLSTLDWQAHIYGKAEPVVVEACKELQLPLHQFPWKTETRRQGLARDALYLVRPDGYVALADPLADPQRLRHYFMRWALGSNHRPHEPSAGQ